MMKLIDAHCHIGNGATDSTVDMFFCNSVTENDWDNILQLARENGAVLPALGVHPWHVDALTPGWDTRLAAHLAHNPHAMVGEIGLDKVHPNYDIQMDVFIRCLNIAVNMQRAVHIHCVRAWGDMVRILGDMSVLPPAMVFHGFAASDEIMQRLLELGTRVYFSYSDAICDARRQKLINSVRGAPLANILIESDGEMSASGDVLRRIAQQIATIKNMPVESLTDTIYNNAQMVVQNG